MRPTIAIAAVLAVSGLSASGLISSAGVASGAATSLGDATPAKNLCLLTSDLTMVQDSSANDGYTVPTDGVITSVRLGGAASGTSSRSFKLYRPSTKTIVASSPTVTIPGGTTSTQSVRFAAKAGDRLGMGLVGSLAGYCSNSGTSADKTMVVSGIAAIGTVIGAATSQLTTRIPVAATLEPDLDADGFGDLTQDLCPSQAATQGICAVIPTNPTNPTVPTGTTVQTGSTGAEGSANLPKPTGPAKVGGTLSAPDVDVPAGFTASYQWFRVSTTDRHNRKEHRIKAIRGAVRKEYRTKKKDGGSKLFVRVTLAGPVAAPTVLDSAAVLIRKELRKHK